MPPCVSVRRHVLSVPRLRAAAWKIRICKIPDWTPCFWRMKNWWLRPTLCSGACADQFPAEVGCKAGCSDCCHAMFDLSLVEAMYINRKFNECFDFGAQRSAILEAAGEADRRATRLKRHYYQRARQGASDEEIMREAGRDRIRCPLLGRDDTCLMYEFRPVTCRLYGVPTVIQGKGHVCGKCSFHARQTYPTIQA